MPIKIALFEVLYYLTLDDILTFSIHPVNFNQSSTQLGFKFLKWA